MCKISKEEKQNFYRRRVARRSSLCQGEGIEGKKSRNQ